MTHHLLFALPVAISSALAAGPDRGLVEGSVRLGGPQTSPILSWDTLAERGVVGFDLLQEIPGRGLIQLNSALVAASNSPSGAAYSMPLSGGPSAPNPGVVVRIWAEDGTKFDQACSVVTDGTAPVPSPAGSRAVSERGPRPAGPVRRHGPKVETVDVFTSRAGVHFLGFDELAVAFEVSSNAVAQAAMQGHLAFAQQGLPVAAWADPDTGGSYFFAPRLDSLYFAGNVTQIRFEDAFVLPTLDQANDLVPTRDFGQGAQIWEKNLQAVPTLPGSADDDFWVWDSFLGGHPTFGSRSYQLDLPGLVPGTGPATLDIDVVSASEAHHQFAVTLNGHPLAVVGWDEREWRRLHFNAEPDWLVPVDNTLQIVSSGDRLSLGYLDRITAGYPRRLEPLDEPMLFSAVVDAVVEARGPAGTRVEVWDVTSPGRPTRLVTPGALTGPEIRRFQGVAGRNYVAFRPGAAWLPDRLDAFGADWLHGGQAGAAYVVIAPPTLQDKAAVLAGRRTAQGLSSLVVPLADIHHEFASGIPTPAALTAFLDHALANWTTIPRYVVLAGDGTYDYRNHLGFPDNLVPPLIVMTPFGRTVTDGYFGDVDRDGLPEIAIGRLPVHTEAELLQLIGQMDEFEARLVTDPKALLLADRPDAGGDFIADANELRTHLELTFVVSSILNDSLETADVRRMLAEGLASGVSLFNYVGHGGRDRFGTAYLTVGDVANLDFGTEQPLVVAMTCAAGQFGLPGAASLGETLLLKSGRAPIGVVSPSGFSINFQAHLLNLTLADELRRQPRGTRLGDTLKRAVAAFREQGGDAVSPALYNLLADPALPLNFGPPPFSLSATIQGSQLQLGITGSPSTTYRVDVSDRGAGTEWRVLGEVMTDAGGTGSITVNLSAEPTLQFYRAALPP